MSEITKTDVKKIVTDEIKKFVTDKLDKEIADLLQKSNSKARKADIDNAKIAVEKLAEFLWIRRSIWKGDIK